MEVKAQGSEVGEVGLSERAGVEVPIDPSRVVDSEGRKLDPYFLHNESVRVHEIDELSEAYHRPFQVVGREPTQEVSNLKGSCWSRRVDDASGSLMSTSGVVELEPEDVGEDVCER